MTCSKELARITPRSLSAREQEVLGFLERGLTNKEIARALGIATQTVNQDVHSLLLKTCLQNRTQLAVAAARDELGLLLTRRGQEASAVDCTVLKPPKMPSKAPRAGIS